MLLSVVFAILICIIDGKYAESPSFVFKVFDDTTTCDRRLIAPSPNDDQLMIFCLNQNKTNTTSQDIFHFNSTKICSTTINARNYQFLSWPLQTKGFISQYHQNQIFQKQSDLCSQPTNFISLEQDYVAFAFRNSTQSAYITLLMDQNQLIECDLSSGALFRNITLTGSEDLQKISYSSNQKYLFAEGNGKVIVYDASSLERLREINLLPFISLFNGMDDGKSFLASNFMDRSFSFFHVDEKGNRVIRMCTLDSVVVVLQESIDRTFNLITYNSTDGGVVQNITLPFEVDVQTSACKNNYLSIIDQDGIAYIYKYTKIQPKPDPKPDPTPDPQPQNQDLSPLAWIMLIIAIIETIAITMLLTIIYRYRKKRRGNNINQHMDKLINSQTSSQISD